MSTCLQCRAPLTVADESRGRCPICAAPIDPIPAQSDSTPPNQPSLDSAAPAKPGTVFGAIDQTLDATLPDPVLRPDLILANSDSRLQETLDSGVASGSENPLDQTIDSVIPSGGASPTHATPGDRTLEYPSDVQDVPGRLRDLWGDSNANEKPHLTIRGGQTVPRKTDSGTSSKMTLVIRERAVRPRTHATVSGVATDYDILGVIGKGGMGVVYSARQTSIDREVAIKMLQPQIGSSESARSRFLSEAAVTGELDHPNIVPIYDLGQNADGALFYSMKKVEGTPWSELIRAKSVLDNLTILMKVADAIAFAHDRGVVHRDLKPENVMLGDYGEVLVLDWGLAVATVGHRDTPNVGLAQGVAGTPAYMSPELAMGPMHVIGKHSDIYLLGAILYEIVTGHTPHFGRNARDCLNAAARNEIVPTDKRGELVDIARKAMATLASDRYETVQKFQDAIRQYLAHSESISLCDKAQEGLKSAVRSDDYRDYARSVFAFEEAHALWEGNEAAFAGISRAKLHYAGSALRKHDYDLGLTLLDPQDPAHSELRELLLTSKAERDARQQRLKRAKRIVVALLAVVFAAISIGIVLVTGLKWEADRQAEIARKNSVEARRQKVLADESAAEANRQAGIARQNEDEAKAQERIAIQNREEADRRRDEAEYEAYVALIGMAAAKIGENAFDQARAALDSCSPALRGWEWGRLHYVVRQGSRQRVPVSGRPECIALNTAGTLLATGTRDGFVEVWDLKSLELRSSMQLAESNALVSALTFSPADDGRLAIGSNVKVGSPGTELEFAL